LNILTVRNQHGAISLDTYICRRMCLFVCPLIARNELILAHTY